MTFPPIPAQEFNLTAILKTTSDNYFKLGFVSEEDTLVTFQWVQLFPPCQPLVALCQDVTISADANCQANVTAAQVDDGSFDPGGGAISLSLLPLAPYPLGETVVTLTVSNGSESSTCTAIITVVDNTAPVLVCNSVPLELRPPDDPPNSQLKTIDVSDLFVSVSDNCSALSVDDVYIPSVSSDEADGSDPPDIVIVGPDCKSVQLRKQRQGGGNGRVYTITLAADDESGNTGTTTCQVTIPPNTGTGSSAVDDGVSYTVNDSCGRLEKINDEENNLTQTLQIPESYELDQNFPNPFNPTTTIYYELPLEGFVTLKVFDVLGKEVKTLIGGYKTEGRYEVEFDATNLPSGIYFYQLRAGSFVETKKMVLMK
ncbi:MAG: T9SS type A sorting domain-containing protein [Bacteroidetes bacterium]|nr:T9SS type A sorting domain-containing protein [Bacteroidota bacterium]